MKHDKAWYVAHVLTGKEQEIVYKLNAAGMRALAPMEIIMERRHGDWWPVRRAAFPGYVFIHVEMIPRNYYYIHEIKGVIRMLGADGPESVPLEQMEAVLHLNNDGRDFGVSEGKRQNGKTIITSGPLSKLSDKIVKVDAHARRATIEVSLLDSTIQVDCAVKVLASDPDKK